MEITDNAMATILICSHLGLSNNDLKPYSLGEWNMLVDTLLTTEYKDPSVLLGNDAASVINELKYSEAQELRLNGLLSRGGSIAISLDTLSRKGIYVVTRGDKQYPILLRKRLVKKTPPILFYAGNLELANKMGIAVVGSRDIDAEGKEYTKELVKKAVSERLIIFSGGARGIDSVSEATAIACGGAVVSFVVDALTDKIKKREVIASIQNKQMLLITDVNPDVGFTVAGAMNRNKYIYASSCGAFVIASDYNKGGTWSGAAENIRYGWVKMFVWEHSGYVGNEELIGRGGIGIKDLSGVNLLEMMKKKVEHIHQEDVFSTQVSEAVVSEDDNGSKE